PGIGKTELVNQFQRNLNSAEFIFTVKFYEHGSNSPYQPYLDSLHNFIRNFQEYSPEGWPLPNNITSQIKDGLDDIDNLINVIRPEASPVDEQIKYNIFELLSSILIKISDSSV